MDEPQLSVVMPLKFYHPVLLQKAVRSITQQTSPLWRLIVVVEPSDLEIFTAVLADALIDPRVELVGNRRHQFPGAINTGVEHARTPFVAILLADDMWALDAVAVLTRQIASRPDVDFFHSSRIVIDEDDRPISPVYPSKESFALSEFPWGSPVKHLLCWRKATGIAAGGIDESLAKAQDDYDFPWVMAEHGATFGAVPECLYYYRNHLQCERLTTHRPLSVTKRAIRSILRKHGIGFVRRRYIVTHMSWFGSLGSQCVYRNNADRWIKTTLGISLRRSWRRPTYP